MPILITLLVVAVITVGAVYLNNRSDTTLAPTAAVEAPAARIDPPAEVSSVSQEEVAVTVPTVPIPPAATVRPAVEAAPATPVTPVTPVTPMAASRTLTTTTTYLTPNRMSHSLDVALTIENDIVTAASITYDDKTTGFSNTHQERFDTAYQTQVVGKKLGDIALSRVGGASLTSTSFNEAVKAIIAQS